MTTPLTPSGVRNRHELPSALAHRGYEACDGPAAVVAARAAQAACLAFEYERVLLRFDGTRFTLHDWYPEWQDPAVVTALPAPFDRTSDTGEL